MNKTGVAHGEPIPLQDGESPASPRQVTPRRISIVGASGSGKSFLARRLASQLDIPIYELDHLRNDADGQRLSDEAFAAVVAQVVEQDAWIIDGHYRAVRQMIWQRSHQVIWLDFPLTFVMRRLISRYRAKVRAPKPDTPKDRSQPKAESASWSSRIGRLFRALREKREYAVLLGAEESAGRKVIRLQNSNEADRFIDTLAMTSGAGPVVQARSANHPLQLIELLGVPGSGKSTVGNKLALDLMCLDRRNLVAQWRSQPAWVKAWHIASSLLDFPTAIASIRFARCARLTSRASIGRLVRISAKRHWVKTRRGRLLLHQGYLQDIWSILAFHHIKTIDQGCVTAFLTALYRGTDPTFIYLDVSPETATGRIIGRRDGNSRLDGLTEDQIRSRLVERIWVADLIFSAAVAGGLWTTKISGHDAIGEVIDNAMRALQERGVQQPLA